MYPGLSHGAYECLHAHGTDEQKAAVPAQAGVGRVDRHHVPDRSRIAAPTSACCARRPSRRPTAATRSPAARSSSPPASTTWPRTSSTWCWRGCRTRRPAPRASRCSSCRSSCPNADGTLGRAQPHLLRRDRGQDGHPRQLDLPDEHGRRHGLADRRSRTRACNAMFVMMNAARLGVGMQSLGLTEVAYQNALAYAKDRLQMRSLSGPKAPDKPADPIIVHPDVRRMLLTAKAYAEGGRAFALLRRAADRPRTAPPGRGGAQGRRRPGRAADADRQGLPHRQRLDRRPRSDAGLRRPRLHRRVGHGAVRARRAHQHDLRGHQHASSRSTCWAARC